MRSAMARPILRTRSANVAKCSAGGGLDVVDGADSTNSDEAPILMSVRASPMAAIRLASVGAGSGVAVPMLRCGLRLAAGIAAGRAVLAEAADTFLAVVFFLALFPVTFFFAVALFLAVAFLAVFFFFAVAFFAAAFRAPPLFARPPARPAPFDPPLVLLVPMRFSPFASVVEIGAPASRLRPAPPVDMAGPRVGPQIPQGRSWRGPIAFV